MVRGIELSAAELEELDRIVGAASSEVRMVERARIVLCAGRGSTDRDLLLDPLAAPAQTRSLHQRPFKWTYAGKTLEA